MIENIEANEHTPNNNPSKNLQPLSSQIGRMLGSKKLLLVLDDFWSDTEDIVAQWEKFIGCLSTCLTESRIVLTTQSKNATQQAGLGRISEVETYNLEEIEEGQFSELFMHYAWPSNTHLPKEEFEEIGRKIAVKLKGDPGAAKLVGHQLSGKLDLIHWVEVAEKNWLGDKMKARIWSYQQLPLDLQRCFAICGLFEKGTMLHKEFLFLLWIAEGFIRPLEEHERLEDIAEYYLKELVSRFFLEKVEYLEFGSHQLHDLFHDLAERVQGDDFLRIDSTNSRDVSSIIRDISSRSENIRHILLPSSIIEKLKIELCLMKNIRTFIVLHDGVVKGGVLQEILKKLKKVRMLHLPEVADDLPDIFGNLKHLRCLYINGSKPLKKLPDSICKLYHLQSLILMANCESLPNDISELISLRCFQAKEETLAHISNVGRFTSLQGLDQYVVRNKRGNELHQLENLNELRGNIHITGLENVRGTVDAIKAKMGNKKHLKGLYFEWNSIERDTHNIIAGLSTQHVQLLDALQPHPNISTLTLVGYRGDRFPDWLLSQNSLKYLASLSLVNCDEVEEIPSFDESLPNCKSLVLSRLKILKKIPSLPPKFNSLVINFIPQLSYISVTDLLKKDERKGSKLQIVKQIVNWLKCRYIPLPKHFQSTMRPFLQFVKERLEATPETCITNSQYRNSFLETVNFDLNGGYSVDQLLDAWVMLAHYQIETMFNKNEESKLVLSSWLTNLQLSSCSITSDALSACLECLISLSNLELSDIQTVVSLPPKKVLGLLKDLQSLTIKNCYLLSSLGSIGALTSLTTLELNGCPNLAASNEPLPSSLGRIKFCDSSNVDVLIAKSDLPVLCALDVLDQNRRGVLHVGHLSCLEVLVIDRWDGHLKGLDSLTALDSICVVRCPEVNCSSPMEKYASAIQKVSVDNLLLLKLILSDETFSSIETLAIYFCEGGLSDDEVFQSLTSLKDLLIYDFNNTHLPMNLKNLASLQYIHLTNCPNLCELNELPRNLRELRIKNCPKLAEKFKSSGPNYQVWIEEEGTLVEFQTEVNRGNAS